MACRIFISIWHSCTSRLCSVVKTKTNATRRQIRKCIAGKQPSSLHLEHRSFPRLALSAAHSGTVLHSIAHLSLIPDSPTLCVITPVVGCGRCGLPPVAENVQFDALWTPPYQLWCDKFRFSHTNTLSARSQRIRKPILRSQDVIEIYRNTIWVTLAISWSEEMESQHWSYDNLENRPLGKIGILQKVLPITEINTHTVYFWGNYIFFGFWHFSISRIFLEKLRSGMELQCNSLGICEFWRNLYEGFSR